MTKKTKAQLAEIEESKAYLREYLNPLGIRREAEGHFTYVAASGGVEVVDRYDVRKHLPTLYFVIDSVSRSGMSRKMRVYVGHPTEPGINYITFHVARVLGWRLVRGGQDAIHVDGCGMDMTFHLADCLLHAVFGYGPEALNANHYERTIL